MNTRGIVTSGAFLQYAGIIVSIFFVACYVVKFSTTSRSSLITVLADPRPQLQNPLCSFDVFRDLASGRADGFVSGTGTWSRNIKGTPTRFQPDICRFRYGPNVPHRDVINCIQRQKLNYIVFAGDSNSERYYTALLRLLTNFDAKCVVLRVSYLHTVINNFEKLNM